MRTTLLILVLSVGALTVAQSGAGGMCAVDPGVTFLFLEPDAAFGQGHVAYGFLHGSVGYFGSIEGYLRPNVLESFSCGTMCSVDPTPMIEYFRSRGYERYAYRPTDYVDFQNALQEAERRDRQSYNVVTSNCAHASQAVLDEFAYAILPTLSQGFPDYAVPGPNFAPHTWFDEVAERSGWTVRSLE